MSIAGQTRAVGQPAVEHDLHVAGPLETPGRISSSIPAAGVDQRGGEHGQRPAFVERAGRAEESFGDVQALMSIPPDIVRPEFDPLL